MKKIGQQFCAVVGCIRVPSSRPAAVALSAPATKVNVNAIANIVDLNMAALLLFRFGYRPVRPGYGACQKRSSRSVSNTTLSAT
jgi:hypothetical protein